MRIAICLLVVCLAVATVEGAKKPKGKGKPSKPKPKPEPLEAGSGSGSEVGSAEKPGKPEKPLGCGAGKEPCRCEVKERKGKGKGKGKPSKPSKPTKPEELSEVCCCESGEGQGSGEKPGSGEIEPSGFCISPDEMTMICTAGSAVAEKGQAAWDACVDQCGDYMGDTRSSDILLNMRAKKPKGKGKGKGKGKPSTKCPKVSKIIDMAAEKYECDICLFTVMGWMDNDMVADEEMILEDVMTLPNEISDAVTGEEYYQCVEKIEKEAMGYEKCVKDYTEEEQATLMSVMNGVGRTECFYHMFDESCGLYMSNTVAAMAGLGNYGSGSGSEGSEIR